MNKDQVMERLKGIKYPGFSRDIVSFGIVRSVDLDGDSVNINLQMSSASEDGQKAICERVKEALQDSFSDVNIDLVESTPGPATTQQAELIPDVKHTIAVASGKGGVGKSTVAVNIAAELMNRGHTVGLLDLDIYGPSLPILLGINERPSMTPEKKLIPLKKYGMKIMSFGFLSGNDTPVIWRGPMVHNAINQFLQTTDWGELDYLIVDLPPGTSDAPLTVMQVLSLDGFVVVTSPQDLSKLDAKRSINMIRKLKVPVLGIVENFSGDIFGTGAGPELAQEMELPFMGCVELRSDYRDTSNPAILLNQSISAEYEHIITNLDKSFRLSGAIDPIPPN